MPRIIPNLAHIIQSENVSDCHIIRSENVNASAADDGTSTLRVRKSLILSQMWVSRGCPVSDVFTTESAEVYRSKRNFSAQSEPAPPKNASDSANFRPRGFKWLPNARSVTTGENSESAALGVESVLRKVRDERQRDALTAAGAEPEIVSQKPPRDKASAVVLRRQLSRALRRRRQ